MSENFKNKKQLGPKRVSVIYGKYQKVQVQARPNSK